MKPDEDSGEDMQDEVRSDQSQRYIQASIYGCHRFSSSAVALPNVDDIFFLFLTAVSDSLNPKP